MFIPEFIDLHSSKYEFVKNNERLILVTNDDGYDAKGLMHLIEALQPFGKLVVVASGNAYSGMSHAITINMPLRLQKMQELEHYIFYKCSGTPVDCVKLALDQILERQPDLLISGINHGSNASVSSLYSGTIAAALEGSLNSIPSLGFSLLNHSLNADFSVAKIYVERMLRNVLNEGLPDNVCLNVNIPDIAYEQIKGVKVCRQARGIWVEEFDKRYDPANRDYYWLTGSFMNYEDNVQDTDQWALQNNYVSVVPLHTDLTAYDHIESMKKWNWNQ